MGIYSPTDIGEPIHGRCVRLNRYNVTVFCVVSLRDKCATPLLAYRHI